MLWGTSSVVMMRHQIIRFPYSTDYQGKNILMHACTSRSRDLVHMILMNKDPSEDSEDGGGISADTLSFSKLALKSPDVNEQDSEGVTAVMIAAREGNWHMIPGLVLAGASLNMKDRDQ